MYRGSAAEVVAPVPLYYGWRVVAALFVVGMMVYGGGLYAFTLFIPPLTTEFGWSLNVMSFIA